MHKAQTKLKQTIPNRFFFEELLICFGKPTETNYDCIQIEVRNSDKLQSEVANWLRGIYQKDVYLYGYDISKMYTDFKSVFKLIKASGGLVQNQKGAFLFIKRLGLWDLPKGKIEKGESAALGAIREVREETGVINPKIDRVLPTTYHIYKAKEEYILKKTCWFLMHTNSHESLVPQLDEDITAAEWLSKINAKNAIAHSYRSLRDSLGNHFDD